MAKAYFCGRNGQSQTYALVQKSRSVKIFDNLCVNDSQKVKEQMFSRYQAAHIIISSHLVLTAFRASRIVPLFSGSKDPDQFSGGSFCIRITFFRVAFQLDCFSPRALFNRILFDPLQ